MITVVVRDRIKIEETGFFAVFAGCNEVLEKKPGFWLSVHKS
ncbi:hypothetical protein QUA86_00010 [Microcoleus sp. F6_B6]